MFKGIRSQKTSYFRKSKLGIEHRYYRNKTWALFICDNCSKNFEREIGKMSKKRLNNNFWHVCDICDQKRYAQKKSVERRLIWNSGADSEKEINKF